jgi:DHA3 family macrolide efflux protein-like MFS transporter
MIARFRKTPGIRCLWIAQLVSISGDFLALFAVLSTATFRLHATAAGITGVTIAYMLPLAIFGPVAGVFADRWNARRTMVVSDLVRAGLVMMLPFVSGLGGMYVVLFSISVVSTFFIPAQSIAIRSLTPREDLLALNGLLQQTMLLTRMLSPAVAAALVARFGPGSCYGLDAVSFVVSAMMISRMPAIVSGRVGGAVAGDFSTGLRFIVGHREIGFVLAALVSATFALGCSSPLLAVLVRDVLRTDVRFYGALSALLGVGMVAGVRGVRVLAKCCAMRELVVIGLAVIGGGMILIALPASWVGTGFGVLVMGAGAGLLTSPAQTLIQSETPVAMMGRVSSAVTSLISVAQILGLVVSGVMASRTGVRPLFWVSGVLLGGMVVFCLAGWRCSAACSSFRESFAQEWG